MKFTAEVVDRLKRRLLSRRSIDEKGCWIWGGYRNSKGYGRIMIHPKVRFVHRLAYVLWTGFDLSSRLCVLHRCDNPPCFNPDHLFAGTKKENALDASIKGRLKDRWLINPNAKLTPSDVQAIIGLRYIVPRRTLAKQFGVHRSAIDRIYDACAWQDFRTS